ncbi:metallophosphoesterase family protein [Corynebacterium fournieri]|uniref:metallophosphoesterase family protein n=1 Tax=Corynebacterium fournieri TaxID=1852390 RepID=UPI000A2F5783|nr:exonuclease SbcCD subunit D [Corynebacterium fournieri]WJY97337.1 putative metallophosphoesterase YhaO [Corynebacterium fournieri]
MTHTTFIHTSDLQLGMRRKFLSPEAQSRFDDARLRAVTRLGEIALERDAEFIVVAGDVFEHNSLEPTTLGRALEALRKLPVPVYLLPGNHDPLVADSIFHRTEGIEGVTVLADSTPVQVREGVEVVGAPLLTKHASEDLCAKAIRDLEPTEAVRILVGHGAVEGFGDEEAYALIDVASLDTAIAEGVIDYVALGDTHSTTALSASERVWFSGAPETTDYFDRTPGVAGGEVDSGNALVVTVAKEDGRSAVEVEKVPVGTWTFEARFWEVAGAEDVAEVIEALKAYPEKDRTVVKYALTGTLGLEDTRMLERELAELEPVFAALYPRERLMSLHLEPGDEEMENLPLTGFAKEAMRELVGQASSDSAVADGQRATARDAVNLLFRLSKEVD